MESLRLRITHKIVDCLRRTTGRNTFVAADCASLSLQNHLVGVIVRVFRATDFPVGRLCESFAPQTSRWGVCASLSRHRLSVGAIARVFQATDFPVGRLCESFEPQTSRWGVCASLSRHRLSGGPIVRVFHATDFPVGRLCESFAPQTSRWADCASLSNHRLLGGAIVRDNRSPRNLFVGAIFQFSSPASVKNSHLCHPEI